MVLTTDRASGTGAGDESKVYRHVMGLIDSGQISGDGRIPTERTLMAALGVSRRSVRKALGALETEGLVWRSHGKGTFAGQRPDPNEALVSEIAPEVDPFVAMEARLCIEPALARLCALRATGEDVQMLRKIAAKIRPGLDVDATEIWDGALHRAIARIAGNKIMLTCFELLNEVRLGVEWRKRRFRARTPELMETYDKQHHALIDAIAARDEAGAEAAMRDHLETLLDNLRASFEMEEDDP